MSSKATGRFELLANVTAPDEVFDAEPFEHGFGDEPQHMKRVVADISSIIDQQQDRNAELQRGGGQAVAAIEQPAVLHQHRRFLPRQVGAGADADAFLFASHGYVGDLFVFIEQIYQLEHIDIGHARDVINASLFESSENVLCSRKRSHMCLTSVRF